MDSEDGIDQRLLPDGDGARTGSGDSYLFPREPHEVNRLDLQHYALREALGANFLAPVHRPEAILDAGTGTGRWAMDVAQLFPHATVVGLDSAVTADEGRPQGFAFVRGNIVDGLPFPDASFDFVHQRLLRAGLPVRAWPSAVAELVRVTRPGGLVELVEVRNGVRPSGPATRRLFSLLLRISESMELDVEGPPGLALDRFLGEAGIHPVRSRYVDVPTGEWGGRMGSFMASNVRHMFSGLAPVFQTRFQVPAAETLQLVREMLEELERFRSQSTFAYFWGRKAMKERRPGR